MADPMRHPARQRLSLPGLAGVAAAHAAAFGLLLSLDARPLAVPEPATLMVEVVPPSVAASPPKPAPAPEPRPLPKPEPVRSIRPPPRTLAAASQAPATRAETPAPTPAPPEPAPAAAPSPAASTAAVPVSAPRFDADYLANPAPAYPMISRRAGEEGRVILRVHVEPDGRPGQIEIKTGSGYPRLDQAAEDAVRRWKFVPARRGDTPVAAWVLVPIVFNLRS